MYDQLLNLDPVKINFSAGGMMVINIVLAFVMYGVALGIKPSMLREVFTKPKSVIVGNGEQHEQQHKKKAAPCPRPHRIRRNPCVGKAVKGAKEK